MVPTANKINAEAGQKYVNVIKKKLDYTQLNYRDLVKITTGTINKI